MSEAEVFAVHLLPSGLHFPATSAETLLRSAQVAGIGLPSACRNGTCRRCLCRLASGTVAYRIEWPGLSREEKAEGYILPCVAHPTSSLVIEAPAASTIPGKA